MPDRVEQAKNVFYLMQIILGVGFVGSLLYFRSRGPSSSFRVREADRYQPEGAKFPAAIDPSGAAPASSAKKKSAKAKPLSLPGIRIDGAAHEILGVSPDATAPEIQRAYRDLIKRYHPDVVGRPGSREWQDAQQIAEAVNRAKDELLRARKRA